MVVDRDADHESRLSASARSHARWVLLLALLCVGLLLDGPRREAPLQTVAEAPNRSVEFVSAAGVRDVLASANPLLSESELHRAAGAVVRYSAKYDLSTDLVTAVMLVESDARPWARSPKGAIGLMQVMPYMMRPLELAGNAATIESNIEAGCFILANNIARLGEDKGISAYFWGSDIRGVAYLERVREARAAVRRQLSS